MNRTHTKPGDTDATGIPVTVNGERHVADAAPGTRLSDWLRGPCGLTGTKIGCNAGDCGACTVLLDGRQACACLVPMTQVGGSDVLTVEGLAALRSPSGRPVGALLQRSFAHSGASQCGICSPGMLMAAADLLLRVDTPTREQVNDALGGVLCRCTGYQKIVEAVLHAGACDVKQPETPTPATGQAVGARIARLDAPGKLDGSAVFGSDRVPDGALAIRVVRSPYARARVQINNIEAWVADTPGIHAFIGPADIPNNQFAIFPEMRDQPALASDVTRFAGEAVLGIIGEPEVIASLDLQSVPLRFESLPALVEMDDALADGALAVQSRYPDNILCRGYVASGDLTRAHGAAHRAQRTFQTAHVEHAYIEPEAGYAIWHDAGNFQVTLFVTTQTPYLDRDEVAHMFNLAPERVRIVPSVVGGGFGGKLDLSVQPLLVAAARKTGRPVAMCFDRAESMRATTKRHPARMSASLYADEHGKLVACDFHGDFDTGPYASWGPTVANRVPIHASGPYVYQAVRARTRAVLTNNPVAGAFRGFGVPQSTLVIECLLDELAAKVGMDPFQLRVENAIRAGQHTPCGQRLADSVGLLQCLQALEPTWHSARRDAARFNAQHVETHRRRGVGVACMWYGIGNTVMANPSEIRIGLRPNGRLVLYNGAVDIGQGTYTILPQICADATGLPVTLIDQVYADTALTADAGKSSASRQTFVSGQATLAAGRQLRERLCDLLGVAGNAGLVLDGPKLSAPGAGPIELSALPCDDRGDVASATGYFNPPTVPLDADGQGVPYATYGFAAQIAEVEVDTQLGRVRVLHIHAAHDVGRAINPTQVEGQVHGGIAQGLGLALMEEYLPGQTDNLHDYLIPTVGDMPAITTHLIEDAEPLGPYGAKGVGEPALVPTAPAIVNAIGHACGVHLDQVPVTPDRLLRAISERRGH